MIGDSISIFIIFLSGIALNLTPCVYPLIPITISYFGARSGQITRKPYLHALIYVLGIAITNSILALIASATGSVLGFMLQSPFITIGISIFLLALALSLFDLWEIRIPRKIAQRLSRQLGGYKGSFFIGLLFGIFAAPCAGPFIIGLMIYVAKEVDPITGFLYFLSLSLGMGIPIGILATLSGMISKLPLGDRWMLWIKRLLAWILIFMSVYIMRPIVGESLQRWLMGIVFFISGLHLGFTDRDVGRKFYIIKRIVGIVFISISVYIPFLYHPQGIKWLTYSNSVLKQAENTGKPVIIDFYADWCMSCVQLDKKVFRDPKVISISKDFIMIRVDLTHQVPYQKALLKRFDIKGLPAVVFVTKKGIFKLEGEITKKEFTKKMSQAILLNNIQP